MAGKRLTVHEAGERADWCVRVRFPKGAAQQVWATSNERICMVLAYGDGRLLLVLASRDIDRAADLALWALEAGAESVETFARPTWPGVFYGRGAMAGWEAMHHARG